MRLSVDYNKCIKAGECYYNHPGLFKAGKEGFPDVLREEITTPEDRIEAESAVDVCPAQAISLAKQ